MVYLEQLEGRVGKSRGGGATGALGRITGRSDGRAGKNHEAERQARWPGTRSNTAQYIRIEGEK